MSDFAMTDDGDIDLSTNDLRLVTGADAVAQHLRIRLRLIKGEYFLDTRVGIPYYSQIWVKNPNIGAVNNVFRRAIVTTPGVESLERLDNVFDASRREYTLTFSAKLEGEDVARDFSEVFVA